MELKDWLNSINFNKNNLVKEDPESIKKYPPFIVNKCLAGHIDCIMFANEMNKNHQLDKDMQYSFYLNSLRKKKRFSPWMRKEELSNLDIIKKYYGYSDDKARQVLPLISEDQIQIITRRLNTGGLK